jgi:oxalate decarboxylase/phosphoglucose isomerase-like protein (cupin superfamily)
MGAGNICFPGERRTYMAEITDLHPFAGINAGLDASTLSLRFSPEVSVEAEERRKSTELRTLLCDPESSAADDTLYTLYRRIAPTPESREEIVRRGLVYTALALRPGTIGTQELARTRGHGNSSAPGTSIAYPEVHEVWHGHGLLYLQNGVTSDAGRETVVTPLVPGDKAVVAPGWASLLVNIGDTPLVVGSWRSEDCILQLDALADLGGMAHFILKGDTQGSWQAEPNGRYGTDVLPPRVVTSQDIAAFGLKKDEPMLTAFRRNPDFLRFMFRPQDYESVWTSLYRGASEA